MKHSILTLLTLAAFLISGRDQGIPQEITALQVEITALKAEIAALQQQVATINSSSVMALVPFVTVDPNPEAGVTGPNIVFHGANIHIESGSGATDDNGNLTGLGNLIIGRYNTWGSSTSSAFGGLVARERNSIFGGAQTIVGGFDNSIQATNENGNRNPYSVIVGGANNLNRLWS